MKKYYSLVLLFSTVMFTSCLKERTTLDPKETNNVVEIYESVPTPTASPADAVYSVYTKAFDIVPSTDFEISISYSGADVAPQDITVNLGLNDGAVNDYNNEQGTGFETLPVNMFSVPSWTVVIPKGERIVKLKVTVMPTLFDLAKTYAFPIQIQSVSFGKISSNFGTVIYTIQAKNQYDGKYDLTFTNYHPSANPGYTGASTEIEMHTSGPNSCKMFWPLADAYCIPSVLGGGFNYFGAQEPNYIIDGADKVTVQNVASGGSVVYTMAAGFDSHYDPATKTFYVKYGYSYATPGVFSAGCREWTQTFEYTGPR